MTFAEVLPALAKGRIAHWKSWDYRLTPPGLEYRALGEEWQQLRDASNQDFYVDSTWEVVPEEPAKHVHFCGLECCARAASDRGTIAGLHGTITDLKGRIEENIDTIARLERELAEARSVCMSGWGCILPRSHAGQCRDTMGNNHGTPGHDTK